MKDNEKFVIVNITLKTHPEITLSMDEARLVYEKLKMLFDKTPPVSYPYPINPYPINPYTPVGDPIGPVWTNKISSNPLNTGFNDDLTKRDEWRAT